MRTSFFKRTLFLNSSPTLNSVSLCPEISEVVSFSWGVLSLSFVFGVIRFPLGLEILLRHMNRCLQITGFLVHLAVL